MQQVSIAFVTCTRCKPNISYVDHLISKVSCNKKRNHSARQRTSAHGKKKPPEPGRRTWSINDRWAPPSYLRHNERSSSHAFYFQPHKQRERHHIDRAIQQIHWQRTVMKATGERTEPIQPPITAVQSPRARWVPRRPPFQTPPPTPHRYSLFWWLHRASYRYLALRLSSIALSPGWDRRRGCSYAVAESSEHLGRSKRDRSRTGSARAMESGAVPGDCFNWPRLCSELFRIPESESYSSSVNPRRHKESAECEVGEGVSGHFKNKSRFLRLTPPKYVNLSTR